MTGLRAELLARLRELVEARKLTPHQVARRSGLHVKTIRRLLRGETMLLETIEQVEQSLRADLLRRGADAPDPSERDVTPSPEPSPDRP